LDVGVEAGGKLENDEYPVADGGVPVLAVPLADAVGIVVPFIDAVG